MPALSKEEASVPPFLLGFSQIFATMRGMFISNPGMKKPMAAETAHLVDEFKRHERELGYSRVVEPACVLAGDYSKAGTFREVMVRCKQNPSGVKKHSPNDDCVAYLELMASDRSAPWKRNLIRCKAGQYWSNVDGVMKKYRDVNERD